MSEWKCMTCGMPAGCQAYCAVCLQAQNFTKLMEAQQSAAKAAARAAASVVTYTPVNRADRTEVDYSKVERGMPMVYPPAKPDIGYLVKESIKLIVALPVIAVGVAVLAAAGYVAFTVLVHIAHVVFR